MISGLYAAGLGMLANQQRQEVVANNIANAMTPGYKSQRGIDKGFYQLLFRHDRHPFWANRVTGPGGGLQLVETYTHHAAGGFTPTGDPLNVALDGPGFLVVNTPYGERFTRDGKFSVDVDGQLSTDEGFKVQGVTGATITVGAGDVQINQDGTVFVDGEAVDRLRVVEFEDPHMLTREGHNLWLANEDATNRSAVGANTRITPATVELSNVKIPYEMTTMMLAARSYAANQRVINAIDETASRLIDQVGMPA
jgi:flagellar basal-body rod protein FlgG